MNKLLVEYLGTTFLIFIIFLTGNYLAIGAALSLAIFLGGKISGGAFNPAVSISLYAAGKLSKYEVFPYIIAEILGGFTAFGIYFNFFKK